MFLIDLSEFALSLQRIPINYLLVNLAISDILYATFITPKIVGSFNIVHPDGTAGSVLCKLVTGGNLAWLPGITSVVTLVAIAVERYYTVLYPLDPDRKLTHRKLKVSLKTFPLTNQVKVLSKVSDKLLLKRNNVSAFSVRVED